MKKSLSIILAILMIVSAVPFAFAADSDYEATVKIGDETTYYETIEAAIEAANNQTETAIITLLKDCSIDSDVTVSNCLVSLVGNYTLTNNATFTVKENGTVVVGAEFINNGTINNFRIHNSRGFTKFENGGSFVNNGNIVCNDICNYYNKNTAVRKNVDHSCTGTLSKDGDVSILNLTCNNCGTKSKIEMEPTTVNYTGEAQYVFITEIDDCPRFEIITKQNGVVVDGAVKAGKYTQSITLGGVTATAELEILHPSECVAEADDGDCTTPIMCAAGCGKVMTEGNEKHIGGTATCITLADCEVCGTPYGDYDTDNHTGGTEIRDAAEATLDNDGYTGDTYCLDCGEKAADGEIIPQLPCEICERAHKTVIDGYICIIVRFVKVILDIFKLGA